jgi:hypothetical protein
MPAYPESEAGQPGLEGFGVAAGLTLPRKVLLPWTGVLSGWAVEEEAH